MLANIMLANIMIVLANIMLANIMLANIMSYQDTLGHTVNCYSVLQMQSSH